MSSSESRYIEFVCRRFEAALRAGNEPILDVYLEGWVEPARSQLHQKLLRIEFEHRSSASTIVNDAIDSQVELGGDRHGRDDGQREKVGGGRLESDARDAIVVSSELEELKPHAQGGLGLVFRANDRTLSRDIALKFIKPELSDIRELRERFRLEAEITSKLEHPGVVPVYGLGFTANNEPFYAMRFIQGESLDEAIHRYHESIEETSLPPDQRERAFRRLLGQFVAVCKTIAYGHNRGVLHRDIKPENVMLGRYGETLVIDWGLALPIGRRGIFKSDGEKTLMPSSGSDSSDRMAGGTPAYMSPEQATGTLDLKPATDIYSLGAMLYKIMVGNPPFRGSFDDIASDIVTGRFEPPSKINRRAPKALESICLKAMSLRQDDRYATALQLAEDVENFLGDRSVSSYREPPSHRLARWSRRNRGLSQSIALILLLLTLAGAASALILEHLRATAVDARNRERELRSAADQARQREREQRAESLSVSSRFAARTIANEINTRLLLLEEAANDTRFRRLMWRLNRDPTDGARRRPVQAWLDRFGSGLGHIYSRAIFICAGDGSQVARYPQYMPDDQPYPSLSKRFDYRDYFHGLGSDYTTGVPLDTPHVSTAMRSTNDGTLSVALSVPIREPSGSESIGVLGMSIALGMFTELSAELPQGQKAILIDTRDYPIRMSDMDQALVPRARGLVLHHENLANQDSDSRLYHVNALTVDYLGDTAYDDFGAFDNFLPDSYRDPLAKGQDQSWLAAYSPVELFLRPIGSSLRDLGWFVIIEQED